MKRFIPVLLFALCIPALAQTPLQPIPLPVFRAFDSNGKPLAGGKLWTYAAGTTTPLSTYTDASGATPNTNPVILDSTGQKPIFLGPFSYKFRLENQFGVQQWTADNIIGTPAASISVNPSGDQTINQPLPTTLHINSLNNVLWADQFPGSDIGAKINAAIAQRGVTCGIIAIAPGSYSFSTPIIKPRCIMIEGNNAELHWTGTDPNTPAIMTGTVNGTEYTMGGIQNLKLIGNSLTPGIYLGRKVGSYNVPTGLVDDYLETFTNVVVSFFLDNYVKGANAYQISFIAGGSTQSSHANWNDVGTGSENMSFFGWQSLNSGGYGFYSDNLSGSEYNFVNTSVDYNVKGAFYFMGGIVRFQGGHIEAFAPYGYFFDGPTSTTLANSIVLSGGVQFVMGCPPTATPVGAWSSSVTYSLGQVVTSGPATYISLVNGNLNHDPTTSPTQWSLSCSGVIPAFIRVQGNNSQVFIDKGIDIYHPGLTVTQMVDWEASGASNSLIVEEYRDSLAPTGVTFPAVQSGANIAWLKVPIYTQYTATDNFVTAQHIAKGTIDVGTIGATASTGFVGAINNKCASPTVGTDLPFNGNFLGWNCDTTGGADFYNPFVNNTNIAAFHFYAKLTSGAFTDLAQINRDGSFHATRLFAGPLAMWSSGTADPTGTCQTGSLFSNTSGASGHVFWACVASAWSNVK